MANLYAYCISNKNQQCLVVIKLVYHAGDPSSIPVEGRLLACSKPLSWFSDTELFLEIEAGRNETS